MIDFQKVVDLLNQALDSDPRAIKALFENRIPWHGDPKKDETLSLMLYNEAEGCTLGPLGILNGLAAMEGKVIVMDFEDAHINKGKLLRFRLEEVTVV